jgi:hypothetical protein
VTEGAKTHGISDQTIYNNWRKHFADMDPVDVKWLRQLDLIHRARLGD